MGTHQAHAPPSDTNGHDVAGNNSTAKLRLQAARDGIYSESPNLGQSHNQAGISSEVFPSHISKASTRSPFPSPNNSNGSVLKRNNSSLSGSDPAKIRKRQADQRYRERCKNQKMQMQFDMGNLKGENDSLKKEKESLKHDNSSMNETLKDEEKKIEQLRNDLLKLKGENEELKRENEKQDVLVQTLSQHLGDPMRLENEKLKDENASLRKIITLDTNLPLLLVEENAKLRIENKALKLQNDALCGKILTDNYNKHN